MIGMAMCLLGGVLISLLLSARHRDLELQLALIESLLEGEAAGLTLADRVSARVGREVSSGQLYPLLRQLEADGMVAYREAPDVTGARGGRPRNIYRLTERAMREKFRG